MKQIEVLFRKHGCDDFKLIDPKTIITGNWVRMKCMFGCNNFGKNATCPPNVPSVSECRQFFDEYKTAAIIHFAKTLDKPKDYFAWAQNINSRLLGLERDIFLSGYQKAFALVMDSCSMCKECSGNRETCTHPKIARPTPEAMAIDVYSTARKYLFPIHVLNDFSQTMNRYAFLLIE